MSALATLAPHNATIFAAEHPLRVLHVINGEHYSGAERVQDLLALHLPNEGCQAGFATLKSGKFAEMRRSQSTPLHPLQMASRWDFAAARRLQRLAVAERYDLLHAHTPRALMVAALASRWTGLPLVYHVHSPVGRDSTRWLQNKLNTAVERLGLRQAARLIAVAPSLVGYMRDLGVSPERIVCVPNGVPITDTPPRPARAAGASLSVGMVALFRPRKGTEVLLEAVATARRAGHLVRLRLIGACETSDYESHLRALTQQLGLDDAVEWTGFTRDVAAELERIDVLAMPSLFGEGLPMVVLEAMAAGLPVVATRVEGNTVAVRHQETGLLVAPNSANELGSALMGLASGRYDLSNLGQCGRDVHAREFSAQAMARGVADVYRQLIAPATTARERSVATLAQR